MQFFDGGAFADCPYIQFPHGMGKQRAPATVVSAAAAARAAGASALPTSLLGSTTRAFMSSSSSATPFAAGRPVASSALVLAPTAKPVQQQQQHLPRSVESAEETTARTAKGLSDSLRAAQQTTEVFDSRSLALQSRQRAASTRTGASSNALSIVVSGSGGVAGARESDPGPIVRSPTKEKKSAFTDALLLRSGGAKKSGAGMREGVAGLSATEASLSSSAMVAAVTGDGGVTTSSAAAAGPAAAAANSRKVVVPFCVSSWQNRKKLVVPVEQRLAQQHDDRTDAEAGMGDAIMDLALAMQQASREVAAELAAKERAKAEEEERQQAALEAAEAEKARVLLEQKAAELAATTQRRETREQRLERIRLERELREQEKVAKQEQRMRERAAARLNISVEDLEADAELLRTVEEASTRVGVVPSSASTSAPAAVAPSRSGDVTTQPSVIGGQQPEEDDDEGTTGGRRKPAVRGGIFASAVISNEGIRREMEALAALEANGDATAPSAPQQQQQQQQQGHDGIHFRGFDENSADEDAADDATGDDFELHNFLPKKKQRL